MVERSSIRGKEIEGVVINAKARKVVCIRKDYFVKINKYERYKKATTKILARVPENLDVRVGDKVKASECRRLGKNVAFIITEKLSS